MKQNIAMMKAIAELLEDLDATAFDTKAGLKE